MRVFVDGEWVDGLLDPWCAPGEVRIAVRDWVVVEELEDLYFEHETSMRRVFDYGREVGPVEVARKVWSRLSEAGRNQKVAAVGSGVVVTGSEEWSEGDEVSFFAPCAPRCCERIVLPAALVWEGETREADRISFRERPGDRFSRWSAWTRESAGELEDLDELADRVSAELAIDDPTLEAWEFDGATPISERRDADAHSIGGPTAVLFGYGHYARTILLPNLPHELTVTAVHELDPLIAPDDVPVVDTSPHLRDEEEYDVVFVSGYHASHAPIAADALRRGASVVSEKPLATTEQQLEDLLDAWREPSRYFAGFHRRYSPVNGWLMEDLAPSEDDPLSYHAIVHEVSLPARHWYCWPSSGSRLLSNGCHWIDHFLWLNDFADVAESEARRGPTGEISAAIALTNGAYFTITLTDRGSDRLGVREHTEVRVSDRTAIITDSKEYVAEAATGLIRREKFHKLAAHRAMYADVGRRLLTGEPGDSRRSVERSARTVLELERELEDFA